MISYMFYPGDFLRDTSHLSDLEELYYRRLIDHYMMTENPIPLDPLRIKRITRCKRPFSLLKNILDEFFTQGEDGFHNARCDREIEKIQSIKQKRQSASKIRWNKETEDANVLPNGSANEKQMECNPEPEPEPEIINTLSLPSTENSPRPRKYSAQQYAPEFESFWKEYPRKTAKGMAYKAWKKLKPPLDVCLSTLEWQKKSEDWKKDNGQFIPYPASWLNARRWEDEPVTQQQNPRPMRLAY